MSMVLTPEQEKAVDRLVRAGLFESREEAISRSHEWLRDEATRLDAIRARIEEGLAQSARGEGRPLDPEQVMQRVRERMQLDEDGPSTSFDDGLTPLVERF